ncbi:transcriptional regulator [Erwinia sp. OLTSP20]|uniref:LysR family transcriptional regulator n=1 Tax=unclassified Erwinia TaxID=2622719 RepID=UPI000C185EB7|nr:MULTISPECIES: LysR family transcriptional regulator [unclassified Erwinia]PIJ49416.1 transcriptional regulator [Erwinia sp. OAMSP11]PIJ71092.1 transcriptional regulator [Erwinia sp. OLSSP12]PIJ79370.1 transcriptional regulator [Erwinia sp. OLCASP19]PIJ80908.1 transcriptional regulator [Erwinia sp. OLMTSP26]PIJ83710.1 transcriptional regulator [Erwinia sp. OLMDSP33]
MDRFQAMQMYVQVVDAGSFSAAARILNIGQPAVSKTIAQLEKYLEVRLLLRTTHGLTPTEAGQRYYERVRITLQQAEEAEMAAREADKGLSGILRVAAAPTFARLHVIPHLAQFMARHPQLKIDIKLDDRPIDLVAEGIDICLRMGSLQDSGSVARKLATSPRSVLATADYLSCHGYPRHPGELSQHDALVFSQQNDSWQFSRDNRVESVVLKGRLHLSAAEGVRAAVLAHMGITVASDWMFSQEIAQGMVQRLLPEWQLPAIDLWAVFPGGRMATAKARQFAAFVETLMQGEG